MTAKTYISERPCPKGHGFVRSVATDRCPVCKKLASAAWYTANLEKSKAASKAWIAANTEKHKARTKAWIAANTEKHKATVKAWKVTNSETRHALNVAWVAANPEKHRALKAAGSRRYSTRKDQRCPKWLTTEDHAQIQAFYTKAQQLACATGTAHAVDHVVPLHGAQVSGLHVPWNLQVITSLENSLKGNSYAANL